jgi:conjugative relaxase-like TrwC/TraI family protein
VLSIGKLAPGRQQYYLDTVAADIEDYYTGAGEAPGRWIGGGSELLGLSGEVEAGDLQAVLDGRNPSTAEPLGRAPTKGRVPGFDTTFCAPKSVSILFALGSREVSSEVRAAHDAAVTAALEVLETETCVARLGHGGAEQVHGDGFVAAAFRHRTSRAGTRTFTRTCSWPTWCIRRPMIVGRRLTLGRSTSGRRRSVICTAPICGRS